MFLFNNKAIFFLFYLLRGDFFFLAGDFNSYYISQTMEIKILAAGEERMTSQVVRECEGDIYNLVWNTYWNLSHKGKHSDVSLSQTIKAF